MPFECTITDDNKLIYENRIYELIRAFNAVPNEEVLNFIVVAIVEYVFTVSFINTRSIVSAKAAFSRLQITKAERALLSIMKKVRDCVVHAPNELSTSLMAALRKQISPDSIKCVLVHFSDKKLIINLFRWMSTHYAVYDNINAYCKKLNIDASEFDKDRVRLMKLLNAYTYRELNEKITALL